VINGGLLYAGKPRSHWTRSLMLLSCEFTVKSR
jgi:hypothetical protein